MPRIIQTTSAENIDLDDLFNDIYYMDFPGAPPGTGLPAEQPQAVVVSSDVVVPVAAAPPVTETDKKRSAQVAGLADAAGGLGDGGGGSSGTKDLTEQQKVERRERNREHAKRSRLRKKFLLESLQEHIHELEDQIDRFKNAIKKEIPDRAQTIIADVCGDKEKYTPLPMPSGFGPVKTLMEPDFRLSECTCACRLL